MIKRVTGTDCLTYINKPIGFANKEMQGNIRYNRFRINVSKAPGAEQNALAWDWYDAIALSKFDHNKNKRKVGYVRKKYDDGGLEIVILGDEQCYYKSNDTFTTWWQTLGIYGVGGYSHPDPLSIELNKENSSFQSMPEVVDSTVLYQPYRNQVNCQMLKANGSTVVLFDEMLDYTLNLDEHGSSLHGYNRPMFNYQGNSHYSLTDDVNTTLVFGEGSENLPENITMDNDQVGDPLAFLQGTLYSLMWAKSNIGYSLCPQHFQNSALLDNYHMFTGRVLHSANLVCIAYNLILTNNLAYAKAYLHNGTLPPDAYLFPLDWDDLPGYNTPDDDGEDGDDDNTPDDDSRDIDPFDVTPPSFIPATLSNYNWYWLDAPTFASFLNWFWHDVGGSNIFDDLINKIQGLYNDLGNAVLMCRYFPCDDRATRIGGLSQSGDNIRLGMIEKSGAVPTLSGSAPPVVSLGHVTVPRKYKSFVDMSPFSECSVYLPFHGFVDLDMNIYNGHDLYIKAVYDHLSGTIQYFLLCDNTFITNTIVAKMAVDIPITLQTKNDRDSMVFQNVSNAVSGMIGAGSTLATGNPIGIMVGANAIASAGQASAPLTVRGTVGESGAFYSDPYCQLIVRRPTISKPETWKTEVGQMCGKSYHLSSLEGKGLTICYNPRITFKAPSDKIPAPLQTEIDEIYDYLEKGVIL